MALENKLGITSSADLVREEERISKKKAVELFEKGLLNQLAAGTFSSLQFIHKYLLRIFMSLPVNSVLSILPKGIFVSLR